MTELSLWRQLHNQQLIENMWSFSGASKPGPWTAQVYMTLTLPHSALKPQRIAWIFKKRVAMQINGCVFLHHSWKGFHISSAPLILVSLITAVWLSSEGLVKCWLLQHSAVWSSTYTSTFPKPEIVVSVRWKLSNWMRKGVWVNCEWRPRDQCAGILASTRRYPVGEASWAVNPAALWSPP